MIPLILGIFSTILIDSVIGGGFNVDPAQLQMKELITNVEEMHGVLMGMAEYIQEIRRDVQHLTIRPASRSRGISVDELLRREELAKKIERLFRSENSTKVEIVKQEMTDVVETNFIKMLAAVLLTGPVQAQEKTPEILRLMKNVLNKDLDFRKVVDRLPFLLRTSETNQFILLLKALRDNEKAGRQLGGLEDLGKVIDAVGKFDLKQVSAFLKEIPEVFESIESIVDGVDEYF